jgi:signal transduction histidine kinase
LEALFSITAVLALALAISVWRLFRARTALQTSDSRYRAFIANSTEGIWCVEFRPPISLELPPEQIRNLCYERGVMVECNDAGARMRGLPDARAAIGIPVTALRDRNDPANIEADIKLMKARFTATDYLNRTKLPDGRIRYYATNSFGIIENNKLMRAWGVQRDLTERVQTEEMLSALGTSVSAETGEAFFRMVVGLLGRALGADLAFVAQASPGETRMRSVALWAPGSLLSEFEFDLAGTPFEKVTEQKVYTCEGRVQKLFPDVHVLKEVGAHGCVACLLMDSEGRRTGLLGVLYRERIPQPELAANFLRILAARASAELERMRLEDELRSSESRYRAFLANSSEGIWRIEYNPPVMLDAPEDEIVDQCNRNGVFAECNDAGARMWDFSDPSEITGRPVRELWDASEPDKAEVVRLWVRSNLQFINYAYSRRDPEGKERHFQSSVVGMKGDGRLLRLWCVQREITDRRQTEEIIANLAKGVSVNTGEAFFNSLVEHLARALRADIAFVSEVLPGQPRRARPLATFSENMQVPTEAYLIAGTASESILDLGDNVFPEGVQRLFPEDRFLRDVHAESYAGTRIVDSSGVVRGYISILSRRPLEQGALVKSAIRIFAARAAAEMDRLKFEADLRESEQAFRALAARQESLLESERTRIAREIHDELGQQMAALRIELSLFRGQLSKGESTAALLKRLTEVMTLLDSASLSVRRIASELRPAVLDNLGLKAAIEWRAREFGRQLGIPVRCALAEAPVRPAVANTVFRIFQESLTNIARHAHASEVRVRLASTGSELVLEIQDNGVGISAGDFVKGDSLGLLGMRERAASAGGSLDVAGSDGMGTTVIARIPVGSPEPADEVPVSVVSPA